MNPGNRVSTAAILLGGVAIALLPGALLFLAAFTFFKRLSGAR